MNTEDSAKTEKAGPASKTARVGRAIAYAVVAACGLCVALLMLLMFEASFGHDGLLCELGIDTDGAGTLTTGCG